MAIGVEILDLDDKLTAELSDWIEIQEDGGGLGSSKRMSVQTLANALVATAGVQSVVPGTNVVVDATDPANPIVSVPSSAFGVLTITAGTGISLGGSPQNRIINNTGVLSVVAGNSMEVTGTQAARTVALSNNIKPGAGGLVTIFEVGTGTLGIGNNATGDIQIGNGATGDIAIRNLLWPTADGTSGQVLTTNGAGVLSWQDGGGGGVVENIVEGDNITVDATDPANPIVAVQDIPVFTFGGADRLQTTALGALVTRQGGSAVLDISTTTAENNRIRIFNEVNGGVMLRVASPTLCQLTQNDNTGEFENTWINMSRDAGVELFYNDVKTFETVSNGIKTGPLVWADSTGSGSAVLLTEIGVNAGTRLRQNTNVGGSCQLVQTDGTGSQQKIWLTCERDAGVIFNYNDIEKLETTNTGISVTGSVQDSDRFICRGRALVTASANSSILASTITLLTFDSVSYDTLSAFNGTDTITVPAGISFAKFSAKTAWQPSSVGYRQLFIELDGSADYPGQAFRRVAPTPTNGAHIETHSWIVPVAPGNTIQVFVQQTSGAALEVLAGRWFGVEFY